jgi:hypothetical protein
VSETIDWAQALVQLHSDHLDSQIVVETIGCLLKDREDIAALGAAEIDALVAGARASEATA